MTIGKGALIKNSGTIAKICTSIIPPCPVTQHELINVASVALPKAIEKMSSELGGLSALQREGTYPFPNPSSRVLNVLTGQ